MSCSATHYYFAKTIPDKKLCQLKRSGAGGLPRRSSWHGRVRNQSGAVMKIVNPAILGTAFDGFDYTRRRNSVNDFL